MTKTQVQQLVLLLLVLVVVIGFVLRKGSAPAPTQTTVLTGAVRTEPAAAPDLSQPPAAQLPLAPEPTLARDIFLIPTELVDKIRQREAEERRIAEEKRHVKPETEVRDVIPAQETNLAEELHLQGIFWGIPRPQALINRRILSVGDKIQDAEIISISKDGVILSVGGQKIELKPPPPIRPNEAQQGSGGAPRGRGWSTLNP